MATEPTPQRAYRAACPNCGAPVEFRSAASAFAVCSYCRSTVVRDGDALRRIGESAELFDDHSPLQLGVAGSYQGSAFTLVGRLQYRYADGTWNEWHALFDSGKSGWLSEDNGRYVIAFDAPLDGLPPSAASLRAGAPVVAGGQAWSVASVTSAALLAVQGELPYPPHTAGTFVVCDLRNSRGEVATLDYGDPDRPRWSVGRSVALAELALTGLAEAAEKTLRGRAVACPSCGAALEVKLATTQSIVCHQCHAVVDVSQGVGGDLQHYEQKGVREPQIPLGSIGLLALGGSKEQPWQVVGYVERCELAGSSDDDAEASQRVWREYLLYQRSVGFAFLIDAEDGWSWSAPITGVPEPAGEHVRYQGALYRKLYDYGGVVIYVLGEFYWRLTKNEATQNSDYLGSGTAAGKRLNREQTGRDGAEEVVWSAGETLSADVVLKAFRLAPEQRAALQRDALPTALNPASLLAKIFLWGFVIVVVLLLFRCSSGGGANCDDVRATYGDASTEYQNCLNSSRSGGFRTGGGAFGGFSSGGGHK